MDFSFIWPIALVILSNIIYHVCARSAPAEMNPFASLIVTYAIGAAASAVMYFVTNKNGELIREMGKINWAPFVLGLVVVGLEAGYLFAYKVGWKVSAAAFNAELFSGGRPHIRRLFAV